LVKVYSKVLLLGIFFSFFTGFAFKASAQCSGLNFTASSRKGCSPLVVQFTAKGFLPGSTFQWNAQGNTVSGKDTITFVYTVPGVYPVQMIVTPAMATSSCPTVNKDTFITVLPSPNPDMRVKPGLTVCSGGNAVIFGDSTVGGTSRVWVLEGNLFTASKVTYTFTGRGTIPVNLSVSNKYGCAASITTNLNISDSLPVDICAQISVNSPTNVVSVFRPVTGVVPFYRDIDSFEWSFPGGTPSTYYSSTPSLIKVTYPDNTKKYNVMLKVLMSDGCSYTMLRKGFISPFITPSFSNKCAGTANSFVVATDASDAARDQYQFSFPGASEVDPYPPLCNDCKESKVTYKDAGSYTAKVSYVYNNGLGCTISVGYPNFVTVQGPAASFISSSNQLCTLSDTAHFKNTSNISGAPNVKYTWYIIDSGGVDGLPVKVLKKLGTSIGPDTSFTPSILGSNAWHSFGVILVAKSTNGCQDSFVQLRFITVASPKADFTTNKISCFAQSSGIGLVAKPTPPAGKTINYKYDWWIRSETDYNDTFVSSGATGLFNPDRVGKYDVKLTISNGHCTGDTMEIGKVQVLGDSTIFTATPRVGCMTPNFISTVSVGKESIYPNDPNNPPIYHWRVDPFFQDLITFVDPYAESTQVIFKVHGCFDIYLDIITHIGTDTCKETIVNHNYICPGVNISFQVQPRTCIGDTIPVNNFSAANTFGYKWSVEPAALAIIVPNDTAKNISIIFNADTCYTVKLIGSQIVGGQQCTDTSIANNVCMPVLKTDFYTSTPSFYCAPSVGRFYDSIPITDPSLLPVKYLWNFDDGDSLLTTKKDTIAHVYTSIKKGEYNVKLTAFYGNGCSYTVIKNKIIDVVGPVPDFTMDHKLGCDSTVIQFKNTSKNVNDFYFFYGDGSTVGTGTIYSHNYVIQDPKIDSVTYFPILLETDDTVCKVYHKDTVKLYRTPIDAKITEDKDLGCVPLTVHFHAVSRAGNTWKWDFDGDGIIDDSTHKDPVFTYKTPGKYRAKLTLSFHGHCPYTVYSDTIYAAPNAIAGFIPNPRTFCGRQVINFKNTNSNTAKYIFNYGDGSAADSNVIIPHTYHFTANGQPDSLRFYPKMIAYNAAGCSDTFKTWITAYEVPVAGFKSSVVSGCGPLKVHFTDTSSNRFGTEWDFNNDGKIDSYGKEADWTFEAGLYSVKLKTFSIHNCIDSVVKLNMIDVNEPPRADFSVSDSIVCYKNAVQFTNLTEPFEKVVSWQWQFGDPAALYHTSSQLDPEFRFYTPGWHEVILTATDDKGCTSTIKKRAVFVADTLPPPNSKLLYATVTDTNSVNLSWNKGNYPLFKSYKLNRLENGKAVEIFSSTNVNDTQFTDASTKLNTYANIYCYSIQTINACDQASFAGYAHCTILLSENALPGPVNSLNWSPYIGWQPVAYRIFRAGADGKMVQINSVSGTTLTYGDTVVCDETYCYFVEAVSDSGFLSKSNITCLHTLYTKLTKPVNLAYVTTVNDNQIQLAWDTTGYKNLSGYAIDKYNVYLGWTNNYGFTTLNTFTDKNVDISGNSYTYRIRAVDRCSYTNPASNNGTSILLNQKISADNVALSWNSYRIWRSGVKYYKVQVQLKNKSYKTIATIADTFYVDDSVYHSIDTAYCYRVVAYENAPDQDSSISNKTCAVLPARVFVPNAFTPGNNDDLNDTWQVSALSVYNAVGQKLKSFNVRVFNRWGTLVFETNDLTKGWDGNFKGKPSPVGVYIYILDAEGIDGRKIHTNGSITLM